LYEIQQKAKKDKDLYRCEPKYPNQRLLLTVGLPLSINHMYVNTGRGGKRLSKVAEQYVAKTRAYLYAAIKDAKYKKEDKCVWHYVDMVFYMPDRKIRDSHNLTKLLLDTMEGVLFNDDYYIIPRIQAVEYDKIHPRVEIIYKPQKVSERNNMIEMFA